MNKIPDKDKDNLEKKKYILTQVSEVQSMDNHIHFPVFKVRHTMMVDRHGRRKLVNSWWLGRIERETEPPGRN